MTASACAHLVYYVGCTQHLYHQQVTWPVTTNNVAAAEGGVVDIQGVCKSTVAKGEDDFPDGILRITDCHDSVIYALAPLQYASITCCSDCTVVVGAVGKMLRVERCERLQLIAGCVRVCISSCHESVFYLGVNRPPLLLGDNRFVQVWSALCSCIYFNLTYIRKVTARLHRPKFCCLTNTHDPQYSAANGTKLSCFRATGIKDNELAFAACACVHDSILPVCLCRCLEKP